ncbi:chromosome partitioning protein ParA [Ramlibacter sp. USB13]|uniref:Chromosome partitioning protein ParA n=1 Tax=Ramlibacter cellulosilyticus TaxID=2764187 RepID=A0A923MRZ8_9BURK|nr:DUF6600 domain-containing protein [Ramlibacter cellulosilyticus]MBC5782752.1 chromosome partitioning protein ParA [Ramlibacter cellulosilyticus]
MPSVSSPRLARLLPWLGALLLSCLAGAALAQEVADPPGRVAFVSERQGSVVFAPQGEDEWMELPQNRPLTEGDRLWTDAGGRAELQLGTATLHVKAESHLGISDLGDGGVRFMLQQGTMNARVRDLAQGENFEVGTPNLAFRALQPGDYRIDVDAGTQQTRVVVHSGTATVFGEGGESIHLGAGQAASFAGRFLAQVHGPAFARDEFARWAEERNRQEDQAVATRYVPRGVVGATELDSHGTWAQDPGYGTVWYPTVTVANWAPYRYGHWSWIAPWGWTWIDDAPWGFAPFHYGRWTQIGQRWAWVPGQLAARPVYSPALVVFLGGGGSQFSFSTGPAVGWYPLAPGEAWYPWYRTSPRYVSYANWRIDLNRWPRGATNHQWRQRPYAVTAVREDDFRRGRPVERHWQPVQPNMIDRARVNAVPIRPLNRSEREVHVAPRFQSAPPQVVHPAVSPRNWPQREAAPAVREQYRARREQDRLQYEAERDAGRQIREQYRQRPDAPRNAGRVDLGVPQRDAGRVDFGGSQRDAGRVEIDQGGALRRFDQQQPRMYRQTQPVQQPVPVPRQQTMPIAREERQPQREHRGWQRGEERGGQGGRWQQREGGDEGRGRGHWNR